jgi:hypothetical protein
MIQFRRMVYRRDESIDNRRRVQQGFDESMLK